MRLTITIVLKIVLGLCLGLRDPLARDHPWGPEAIDIDKTCCTAGQAILIFPLVKGF